jgi:hypothetical protein
VRAGNEHTNAIVKSFRIMNSRFRGRIFKGRTGYTRFGRKNLKAAIFFCCHVRAAHHEVYARTRRDLSVLDGLPILNRRRIADQGDRWVARVKASLQRRAAHDGRPPARARRRRSSSDSSASDSGPSSSSSASTAMRSSASPASSASSLDSNNAPDAVSVSSADDPFAYSSTDSSDYEYEQRGRRRADAPAAIIERPHGDLEQYTVNLPGGIFDVKIFAIDDANQTAMFEYAAPYAHYAADSRPWALLRPKNAELPVRRGRGQRR